jgi:hypothetical protein
MNYICYRSAHEELIFKRKVHMKITNIVRREFCIHLTGIPDGRAKNNFIKKATSYFSGNKDVMKIVNEDRYLWNGIEHDVKLRIVTPAELNYESGLYSWSVGDFAKSIGTSSCDSFVPIRIAMLFEELRKKLPEEYSKSCWAIHMSSLEARTSDMFVSGYGCPKGVFQIFPSLNGPGILSVEWVYGGRRAGVYKEQPLLLQCR